MFVRKWGDHVANKTSTSREALNGADIYYERILKFFEAVGDYNQVNGIFQKLGQLQHGEWTPGNVSAVYKKTYRSSPQAVKEAREMYDGRIKRLLSYIGEALDVMHIEYTQDDLNNFEMLARGTHNETKFRIKVGGHVKTLQGQIAREMMRRLDGKEPKPIVIETPADLIRWYQARPKKGGRK